MTVYKTFLLVVVTLRGAANMNNECTTYADYSKISTSKNCRYNPDIFASLTDIIGRHVGRYERYSVTTEDGYILSVYRIPPKGAAKGVVLLQHPLNTDAEIWVSQGPESLAFNFSNSGYDVWLPNNRGTPESYGHVNLTIEDRKYWDFGLHEIGMYDYVAIIDFIKQKIGSPKIIFIGHSMSTTASFIYAALKPDHAERNIEIFFEMTPIAYMRHVQFELFAHICIPVANYAKYAGIVSIFTQQPLVRTIQNILVEFPNKRLLIELLAAFSGWTPDEFDVKYINVALSHAMKPFSLKTSLHYCQMCANGGHFRMFDYGMRRNLEKYGSIIPPEYPIQRISTPTFLISGEEDSVANTIDADILYNKLSDKATKYGQLKVPGMNHVDFQFGRHRYEKVFDVMWSVIKRIKSGT